LESGYRRCPLRRRPFGQKSWNICCKINDRRSENRKSSQRHVEKIRQADDAGATLEDAIKTVARKGSKLKPEDLTKFLKDGAEPKKWQKKQTKS
jgi:hypothetical protein